MKQILSAFTILIFLGLQASSQTSKSTPYPDCIISATFTAVGSSGPVPAAQTPTACAVWIFAYTTNGTPSAVSIAVQTAPDLNGLPGSWTNETATTGSNPNTSTTSAVTIFGSGTAPVAFPWWRINLGTLTGGGKVTAYLYGWKLSARLGGSGGGGAVGSLTTLGNGGAATLISTVLNIPIYASQQFTLSASGNTITLNGAASSTNPSVACAINASGQTVCKRFTQASTIVLTGAGTGTNYICFNPNDQNLYFIAASTLGTYTLSGDLTGHFGTGTSCSLAGNGAAAVWAPTVTVSGTNWDAFTEAWDFRGTIYAGVPVIGDGANIGVSGGVVTTLSKVATEGNSAVTALGFTSGSHTWTPTPAFANVSVTLTGNITLNVAGISNGDTYTINATEGGNGTFTLGTGCTWIDSSTGATITSIPMPASGSILWGFLYDGTNCNVSYPHASSGGTGNAASVVTTTFSATPTFTCPSSSAGTVTDFVLSTALTANITSSTLASCTAGQILNFLFTQDGTGSRTVAMPTGFSEAPPVVPIASSSTKMSFWWDGTNAHYIVGGVVSGVGMTVTQAAPSVNPPSGDIFSWCDSTDLDCEIRNASGSIFKMFLSGGDCNPVTGVCHSTNLAGGAIGYLPYQSAANTTLFVAGNTAATDQVLTSTGTGSAAQAPTLKNAPALSAANMTSFPTLNQNTTGYAAGIAGGAAGELPYQTGANATGFSAAGTAKQVALSGGIGAPTFIDFPERYFIPAANCNNTTAGAGWSIGSGGTVTCRAGTNNLGGYVAITDTSSTFAQFTLPLPEDWDSATLPYIRFQLAYPGTDGGSSHTIIPQIKVACTTATSGVSDDPSFAAAHSSSTITLASATANFFFSTSSVQTNSTDMTSCVAGGLMIVQVGRATDTATSAVNFYGATVTFPRLLAVQAN